MAKMRKEHFLSIISTLIEEGKSVMGTQWDTQVLGAPTFVESQALHRWWGKVRSLGHQLGSAGAPWQAALTADPERNTLAFVKKVSGTLEAIKYEIENDHLETVTALVKTETLADLLEQAEHLYQNGYFLAAGVIGRAVLEEHLSSTCSALGCLPERDRPTIHDYNQSLYAISHYNKIKLKHVDSLASVGNDAAHNQPDLSKDDVARLLQDLPGLIESTRA